jgi:hypothetical protein
VVSAVVLSFVVEISGCARAHRVTDTTPPVSRTEPPPTPQAHAIFVDGVTARRVAKVAVAVPRDDPNHDRVIGQLREGVHEAQGEDASARNTRLKEALAAVASAMNEAPGLATIHPTYVERRRDYTDLMRTVLAQLAGADGADDDVSGSDEAIEAACAASVDATTGAIVQVDAHARACEAVRAGALLQAAEQWLECLADPKAFAKDDQTRAKVVLAHDALRWRLYAESGDFEHLVTGRSLLLRHLASRRSNDTATPAEYRRLHTMIARLDILDAELLRLREATWTRFAMESEDVRSRAAVRARREMGGGTAAIVLGALGTGANGWVLTLMFLLFTPVLIWSTVILGAASITGIVLGAKLVKRSNRARRALDTYVLDRGAPPAWFQPGVGRRLRDPTGLFLIEGPELNPAKGAVESRRRR